MARTPPQNVEFNTFVAGINTEASPLTFPENASLDEYNFDLLIDGSRKRRLGMDYESGFTKTSTGVDLEASSAAFNSFVWEQAGGSSTLDIIVVQIGSELYFFDSGGGTPSDSPLNGGSSLTIAGSDSSVTWTAASLNGSLILTVGTERIIILTYDEGTDTVTQASTSLETRDLWGEQPDATLTGSYVLPSVPQYYLYNITNQGFPISHECWNSETGGGLTKTNPAYWHYSKLGRWPATSSLYSFGVADSGSDARYVGAYSPWLADNSWAESTILPAKGKVIVDIFNRGAARAQAIEALSFFFSSTPLFADVTYGRVNSVASYAGRVFYTFAVSGVEDLAPTAPNLATSILFSQTAKDTPALSACYAQNDPTAVDFNQPLDTDGGFISIPEAGQIFKCVPMGNSLFVFAANGVWEVHGGENVFSATNQSVSKVSSVGAISTDAIISGEDGIMYWSKAGIYRIGINDVTLRGLAENITQNTIQGLYNAIPEEAKTKAKGVYDQASRQFKWLYRSNTLPNEGFFDSELVFHLNLGAFSVNKINSLASDSPYVGGYIPLKGILYQTEVIDIIDGTDDVFVLSDDVVINDKVVSDIASSTKYLAFMPTGSDYSFTFAEYGQAEWYDWKSEDDTGVDAAALLLTGYLTAGDSSKKKQANYMTTYMKRTEDGFSPSGDSVIVSNPSGCLVQSQWEWTNNAGAGKWGREFQAYRLPRNYTPESASDDLSSYGYTVVRTKSSLRGHGRALSLQFKTEAGKDCHIYGWGLNVSATTIV